MHAHFAGCVLRHIKNYGFVHAVAVVIVKNIRRAVLTRNGANKGYLRAYGTLKRLLDFGVITRKARRFNKRIDGKNVKNGASEHRNGQNDRKDRRSGTDKLFHYADLLFGFHTELP